MKKIGAPIAVSNAINNVKDSNIYYKNSWRIAGAFRESVSWIIDQQKVEQKRC